MSGILIDRNPDSEFVLAKPHGRVGMAVCVVKVVLALVFSLQSVSASVLLAVLAVSAAVLLYGYLYFLPFYTPTVNSYHCAFAMLYAWGVFCTVIAFVRDAPSEEVEGFGFLLSSPGVVFSGYAFARQRFFAFGSIISDYNPSVAAAMASAPTSACMVELRQRQLLAYGHSADRRRTDDTSEPEGVTQTTTTPASTTGRRRRGSVGSLSGGDTNAISSQFDVSCTTRENNDPTMAPRGNFTDVEDLAVRRPVLLQIDKLYEAAVAGPDCGALLRLFLAQYLRVYCANQHMEQLELRALQSMSLPFDVAFFVYQRCRELKLEEKASRVAGTMTIEAHMKFDTYKARADRQVLSARENQAELWSELTNSNPSLARLEAIGKSIERWMTEANDSFQTMLRLNPSSVVAMRRYAQFLQEVSQQYWNVTAGSESVLNVNEPACLRLRLDFVTPAAACDAWQVMNNGAKAEALQQQADDLEEASAKEFAEKSAHFIMCQRSDILDGSREDMAIVSVSQTMESLGLIESANSVALTMFGYSKRDLLKKSVSVLVPFPMSTMHHKYVQAYVETGRTVRTDCIHESDPAAGPLALEPHAVLSAEFHIDVHSGWHATSTKLSVVGSNYSYSTVTLACSYDGHRWLELHDLYGELANYVH